MAEQSPELRPMPVYLAGSQSKNDEASLADFWRLITRHKGLALLGFSATLLLAVIYLFNAEPVYKATAHLLPPQQQDFQGLLIEGSGLFDVDFDAAAEGYRSKTIFNGFLDNLGSKGLRREFFDKYKLINHYVAAEDKKNVNKDQIFDAIFNRRLQVSGSKNSTSSAIVSFSDSDPKLAAHWVNQFIDFTNKRTVLQLFNDVNSVLQAEKDQVRDKLASKLKLAEQRRLDTITTMKEALHVAGVLGLVDSSMFPKMTDKSPAGLAVNTAQVPLYMRGTEALKTEISVLESRKSDEPFIDGYRDLEERLAFLDSISIKPASLSAVTIDDPARIPYRLEKPNKKVIAFFGIIFGIIVGVIMALSAEFLSSVPRESGL